MILEVAILNVKHNEEIKFEMAFLKAQQIIMNINGYISHQLQRCIERPNRYILLVNWNTLESHTIDFRLSDEYDEWRKLLHHFYEPFPEVEHYKSIFSNV